MAVCLGHVFRHALKFVAFTFLFASPLVAQSSRERLGELELSVDASIWRIERPQQHTLNVVPIGKMAKTGRPVVVTQTANNDIGDCEVLARAQLPSTLYGEIKKREIEVGGVKAVEVRAHTRCRNLTPVGMAICIPRRGIGYVVVDRIVGCRAGGTNPFSRGDWFEDLIGGIRFAP